MLFCYISIINTVKRGNALSAEGDLTDRQRKIERDVTIVSPDHSAVLAIQVLTLEGMLHASGCNGLVLMFGLQFLKNREMFIPVQEQFHCDSSNAG